MQYFIGRKILQLKNFSKEDLEIYLPNTMKSYFEMVFDDMFHLKTFVSDAETNEFTIPPHNNISIKESLNHLKKEIIEDMVKFEGVEIVIKSMMGDDEFIMELLKDSNKINLHAWDFIDKNTNGFSVDTTKMKPWTSYYYGCQGIQYIFAKSEIDELIFLVI